MSAETGAAVPSPGPYRVVAPRCEPVAGQESPWPLRIADPAFAFDVEADVVIVGGGCGGLATALFSRWLGDDVVLAEKAPELGGTTYKGAFWYWVPNNGFLQAEGIADPEEDFIRFCTKTSLPERYDPGSPRFGATEWEHSMFRAIYESSWPAAKLLAERDVLPYRSRRGLPTYYELSEDRVPKGRALAPARANKEGTNGGRVAIEDMSAAAIESGVDIRLGYRVQRLVLRDRAVLGVVATTVDGRSWAIGARKGVVFASGGFTHDAEMCRNFLSLPSVGGCAARTNEGDFVRIGTAVGAQLGNMQYAWRCPVPLEGVVSGNPHMVGTFALGGDSSICVNYRGRRVANEKLPYNEFAQYMGEWDPVKCEYPNRIMIQIWDSHAQEHSATTGLGGSPIVPDGEDQSHVVRGDSLPALVEAIRKRLERYREVTGDFELDELFLDNLKSTIVRWNSMAKNGVDEDFHRGDRMIERSMAWPVDPNPAKLNSTMWPISEHGPYFAVLLAPGTLDTKGGPVTNPDGQVLDSNLNPIPGLYGVGNCVASASRRAYWAAGATLGPILGFSYRAANAVHLEEERPLAGQRS
jgi:3-oxosteroid 1-dehydrogenase